MSGRGRSFDKEKMLGTIMCTFWKNGYAGTTMADLTEATGLTKPSLYLAYGNKESMFKASLEHYLKMQSQAIGSTLGQPNRSVRLQIGDFLKASAKSATSADRPSGCFVLAASTEVHSNALPAGTKELVEQVNASAFKMLTGFFSSVAGGAQDPKTAAKFAEYVLVLQSGIMQMALRGSDYPSLERAIPMMIETFEI